MSELADFETKLTTLSADEKTRGSLTDAQLAAIDLKQLTLEAFFAKLGANAIVIYRSDAAKRQAILDLLPRSVAGRGKPAEEQPPADSKNGTPPPAATDGTPAAAPANA